LVAAAVVYYFGLRQSAEARRNAFREKQLSEFYAPLAGLRQQVRAKSDLRLKISGAAESAWQEEVSRYHGQIMHDHEERIAPFKKIIAYNNDQLEKELLPAYRQMLAIFTDRYHLAEPATRAYYSSFLEFVEIWNRFMAESLPTDVLERLKHSEDAVKPFYEHLENKVTEFQTELLSR
jgi:hypothetical protein